MVEMIATSKIDYPPSKSHKPGDRFEVEDAHVKLLIITGRAKLPDEYETRDMTAGPAENYQTRDMGTLHVKRKYTRRETA